MKLRIVSIGAGLAAVAAAGIAHAEDEAMEENGNTITVTATKAPVAVVEAPATVSVITDLDIDDTLVEDIKDLVRFEPGVSVRSQPARFTAALSATGREGNAGFNIRGLEGNRVLIQTDGIRLPEGFAFGAQSVGRGDYADLDLVKSVEILRGPASALYGSDGLAGAVSFITKDPEDFLEEGQRYGGRLRLGYTAADEGWAKGAALAVRLGDQFSVLGAYTRRDSGPQENQGKNDEANTRRTVPNPQENNSNALLGKLVWDPGNGHRVRLTGEYQSRDSTTEVLSARAIPPVASPTGTLDLDAYDRLTRSRISLDWRYAGGEGLVESAYAVVYNQRSKTRQYTAEDRNVSADRIRDNTFNNRVTGLSFETRLALGGGEGFDNRLLVGGDYSVTRQTGVRDGTVPPAGETFPTRAFPVTDYTLLGLFLQDTIDIGNGRLLIYPGLRFDHYKLDPKPDATFPGTASKQSDEHFSPKLGVVGWVSDTFGLFASYAQGFRSPTPSQVNNGFANPIQNYVSIANPDLKPETSRAFEGGLRIRNADLGGVKLVGQLTAFSSRYRNFIEQIQVSGTFTPVDPAVFQYVNRGRVKVSGVEGRLDAEFGGGLGASFSAAYADGKARSAAAAYSPLSSVEPVKLVAGLRYREPENRFGGQLILTHSAGKKQTDISEACSPNCFTGDDFTILDATAFLTISKVATLRVGVFNLFDTKYHWWSDIRGLTQTPLSTTIPGLAGQFNTDTYTQPGRNVSASITLKF